MLVFMAILTATLGVEGEFAASIARNTDAKGSDRFTPIQSTLWSSTPILAPSASTLGTRLVRKSLAVCVTDTSGSLETGWT